MIGEMLAPPRITFFYFVVWLTSFGFFAIPLFTLFYLLFVCQLFVPDLF